MFLVGRLHWHSNMKSKIVETEKGPVECLLFGREGPYVIALHGTPGGYIQILPYLSRLMSVYPCRVLAVSRPGYGNTPLSRNNVSFEDQADIVKSLMDSLEIDKAIVYGISAGGAVAIHFAAKYQDRCKGLVLESSVGMRYAINPRSPLEHVLNQSIYLGIGAAFNRFMAKHMPKIAIRLLLGNVGNLSKYEMLDAINGITSNPIKLKIFRQLVDSFSNPQTMVRGMCNDLHHLEHSAQYPLDKINVHTLVIHGTRDSDVSIEHADFIVNNIKHARLLEIYGGTHILPLSNRTWMISNAIIEFLDRHG